MGTIEDLRKVLQDFLAPELRAISARQDSVTARLDAQDRIAEARHNELLARIDVLDKRIDGVDKRIDGVDKRIEGLTTSFDLDKRLSRLEEDRPHSGAPTSTL